MRYLQFLFVILIFASPLVIRAQETTSVCDPNLIDETIASVNELLVQVQEQSTGGDVSAIVSMLAEAESAIAQLRAQCSGLSFQGSDNTVLGPIEIPDGTYRVTVTTDGYFIADVQVVSGNCGDSLGLSLFILSSGDANAGAETVFNSSGCSALIAVDNVTEPWKIVFQNLTSSQSVDSNSGTDNTDSSSSQTSGATISYNAEVDGFLFANMDAEYFFEGNTGDTVTIGAVRTSGTADLALQLYAPTGTLLFEDDDSHPEGFLNPQITNLPLPASGQYRILVTRCSFCDAADSAGFRLTLSN
jgi:hypothetical protein